MIVEEVEPVENSDVEEGECTDDSDDILSDDELNLDQTEAAKADLEEANTEKPKEDTDMDLFGRRYRSKSPKEDVKKEKSFPKEKGLNYFSDGDYESDSEEKSKSDWCWRRKAKPGELDDDFDGLMKNQQRNRSWRNDRSNDRRGRNLGLREDPVGQQPHKFQMRRQPRPPRRAPKPFPTPQKKQPYKPFPKPPPKQPPPPEPEQKSQQVWTEPKEPWTGPRRYDLQSLQITAAPPPPLPLPSPSESWTKVYSKDAQQLDRSIKERYPDKKRRTETNVESTESRKRRREEFETYPPVDPEPRRRRKETSPRRHRSRRSGRRTNRSNSRERSKNPRNIDDAFYNSIRSKNGDHSSDDQDRRPLRLRESRNSSRRRKRKRSSSRSPRKFERFPRRSKQMVADFPTPSRKKLHTNKDAPMSEEARRKAQTYESYGDERVYICYPDENGKTNRKFPSYVGTKSSERAPPSTRHEHYHENHDRRRNNEKKRRKRKRSKKSMLINSSSEESGSSSSEDSSDSEDTVPKTIISLDEEPPAESLIDRYPLEKKDELKQQLLRLAKEKTKANSKESAIVVSDSEKEKGKEKAVDSGDIIEESFDGDNKDAEGEELKDIVESPDTEEEEEELKDIVESPDTEEEEEEAKEP